MKNLSDEIMFQTLKEISSFPVVDLKSAFDMKRLAFDALKEILGPSIKTEGNRNE